MIRFPEDDKNAWSMFLYWITKRGVPAEILSPESEHSDFFCEEPYIAILIRCWILGDR